MNFNIIHNPFKIIIDNVEFIDIIFDRFETVDISELTAYCRYEQNNLTCKPTKEVETDLKKLLNLSAKLGENADNRKQCTAHEQALLLANKGVIYTGNHSSLSFTEIKKYYRFDKKQKLFVKLSSHDIRQMVADYFGKPTKEINIMDIEKAMRNVYPEMIVNDAFPIYYNNQKKMQAQMKDDKKAHDKIENIVAKFE